MTKYMHTLDGQPATYSPSASMIVVSRQITLRDSLPQIRRDQRDDRDWCERNNMKIQTYGYVRVRV
jgi:hypothetical protein